MAGRILEDLADPSVWDISKVERNTSDRTKVMVEAVSGDYSTGTLMNTAVSGDNVRGIVVATGNVTVDADFRGLVIAGGDVTVEEADFDGLILATGNVSVTIDQ